MLILYLLISYLFPPHDVIGYLTSLGQILFISFVDKLEIIKRKARETHPVISALA
nr:MAG TPA: hypothetical protein [Caudoviricetes sp.]